MEEYFDKPDSYIPERWVRGGSASSIHPYLLLPFGFGPRTCAGRFLRVISCSVEWFETLFGFLWFDRQTLC